MKRFSVSVCNGAFPADRYGLVGPPIEATNPHRSLHGNRSYIVRPRRFVCFVKRNFRMILRHAESSRPRSARYVSTIGPPGSTASLHRFRALATSSGRSSAASTRAAIGTWLDASGGFHEAPIPAFQDSSYNRTESATTGRRSYSMVTLRLGPLSRSAGRTGTGRRSCRPTMRSVGRHAPRQSRGKWRALTPFHAPWSKRTH